jgi:hypothetical protein
VGVAGHNRFGVFFGPVQKHGGGLGQFFPQPGNDPHKVKAKINGDLIVPAPAGVKHAARVAEFFGKEALDKGMNVFGGNVRGRKRVKTYCRQTFGGNPGGKALKLAVQRRGGFGGNNSPRGQHGGVGAAAGNIIEGKAPIHGERRLESEGGGIGLFF